ncbi:hypothetical protein NML43_07835 [Rhodopseudomonas palustris]|uniref:hypothetical protein n=1 Tax=Rhodopseudomonas palustris TaxID=1076 RepID=UPI0020CF14F2|nr:hypothetical protein [Rhodopseudomonas palustris]MCP9626992.1 hypothetical protein [Rhodopseudomonas palustris]
MSLILACAFVLTAPSVAGSSEGSMPGVGTFAYPHEPANTATVPQDGTSVLAAWTK